MMSDKANSATSERPEGWTSITEMESQGYKPVGKASLSTAVDQFRLDRHSQIVDLLLDPDRTPPLGKEDLKIIEHVAELTTMALVSGDYVSPNAVSMMELLGYISGKDKPAIGPWSSEKLAEGRGANGPATRKTTVR
jgi:hypothetical protein